MDINKKEIKEMVEEEIKKQEGSVEAESKSGEKVTSKIEADINVDDIGKRLAESVVKAVQEQLGGDTKDAEHLAEKVYTPEEGLKTVKYPAMGELKNLSDGEQVATYYKALFRKIKSPEDHMVLKGLSEGTAADGGNLVPTPLHNEVFRLVNDLAVMRGIADTITMTSDTLKLPSLTKYPKAYWIGERVTKTTTSAEFGVTTLNSNKLVARILISEELNDDAIVAMVPFISKEFAKSIAEAEDDAFFSGSGAGQPRGINIEAITGRNAAGVLNFDEIIRLMDLVGQGVRKAKSAAFVAHKNVISRLRRVKDANNAYIWRMGLGRNDGQVERLPEMIYNYPIYEQNDIADTELYFGDWSFYKIGDRKQLTVRTTDQNETAWTQDAIDVKAVERIDGRAAILGAFAKLTGL